MQGSQDPKLGILKTYLLYFLHEKSEFLTSIPSQLPALTLFDIQVIVQPLDCR
jgi:hypothetical protein